MFMLSFRQVCYATIIAKSLIRFSEKTVSIFTVCTVQFDALFCRMNVRFDAYVLTFSFFRAMFI